MTEDQKERYNKYYNGVLLTGELGYKIEHPSNTFNEFGLKFSVDYLNRIGKNVIMFPLEIMADYVDEVTKKYIDTNNLEFIDYQIHIFESDFKSVDIIWENLNATSIGNLAYICLNSKNEKAKEVCEKILQDIFVKMKGILLTHINENAL